MQLPEFRNEPPSDFRGNPEHARRMKDALDQVGSELGRDYDLVIGGKRIKTQDKLISYCPENQDLIIGTASKGDAALADRAIRTADEVFKAWSRVPLEQRVEFVLKIAKILREKKFQFSAWLVFEVGKTWPEADADTAEAIDFCEFYSREMLRLAQPLRLTPIAGERNYLRYIPLGVGVAIPPWNFPLAILAGMTLA